MDSQKVSDSVVAGMMASAVDREAITSLWSSFITPQNTPGGTLKDIHAPGYAPPEILSRTVTFPGEAIPNAYYTILSQLGEGGMGVVFEARQNHLDRTVALKMIRPGRAGDPLVRATFFHEAVITAGLEHPGIVPVLEFGRDQDGRDFYVMKKATGVPWSRVIRSKTLEENLAIFDQVADVTAYAHSRGILHRDLKPANVLLGDFGEVWVGDWGVAVARGADGTYGHAHPGGTPTYMPPEMARGDAGSLGVPSDIYLLAAILLEMVTGTPPHAAGTALDAILKAADNVIAVDGDHPLMQVIRKALAESPDDRYASVEELRDAISECLALSRCRAHMVAAEKLYKKATRDGDYILFQRAIAEYDSALMVNPGNGQAQRDRLKALTAYSRTALANGEYDLAQAIVEPEIANSSKAAVLANTISQQKEHASRKKRRSRAILAGFLAMILLGVGVAAYIYLANRAGIDNLIQAASTYDDRMQQSRSLGLYSGIRNELRSLTMTVTHSMASDPKAGTALAAKYDEMQQILLRCDEEFRFPDQADSARREAACQYVLEQYPRLAELVSEMASIDATLSVPRRQSPVPELARQFSRFSEFMDEYRVKGL